MSSQLTKYYLKLQDLNKSLEQAKEEDKKNILEQIDILEDSIEYYLDKLDESI